MSLESHSDSRKNHRRLLPKWRHCKGLSLLELLVVLVLLSALAVLALPLATIRISVTPTETKSPQEVVTIATLATVRDALMSEHGVMENLGHVPDVLPVRPSELVCEQAPQRIQQLAPELASFQPFLGIGWRGPYLLPTGVNLQGEPTIVDGWGNEITIRAEYHNPVGTARPTLAGMHIISPGPNGALEFGGKVSGASEPSGPADQENDDVVVSIPVPCQSP